VLIQNAVGSGTGGGVGGTGAEEVTDVSCAPRMNEPDMIMIVKPFFLDYKFSGILAMSHLILL